MMEMCHTGRLHAPPKGCSFYARLRADRTVEAVMALPERESAPRGYIPCAPELWGRDGSWRYKWNGRAFEERPACEIAAIEMARNTPAVATRIATLESEVTALRLKLEILQQRA